MKQRLPVIGLVLPLLTAATIAQELKVGMDAPPLKIAKWVKGDAVDSFAAGKVYVVEFWATWCGPCIASMPHLTAVQAANKAKGVTVIGVTTADQRGNTQPAVEAMVAEKGEGMGYTVAWDDGSKTSDAYMKAARQGGIPCAFLVDGKGKLAYIGHPAVLDIPLAGVLDGTWDASKGKETIDATLKKMKTAVDAAAAKDGDARGVAEAALGKGSPLQHLFDEMLYKQLVDTGKWDRAFQIGAQRVDVAIAAKDPMTLNEIAWDIVDPAHKIEKRDLDLAMKAATKAVEITKEKDGAILDTLARAWFWKQDYNKALDLQKKAVALSKDDADIKKSFDEYQGLVDKAKGEAKK